MFIGRCSRDPTFQIKRGNERTLAYLAVVSHTVKGLGTYKRHIIIPACPEHWQIGVVLVALHECEVWDSA